MRKGSAVYLLCKPVACHDTRWSIPAGRALGKIACLWLKAFVTTLDIEVW